MKKIVTILFLFFVAFAHAQKSGNSVSNDLIDAEIQFKNDIKNNDLKIYTLGGFYRGNYDTDIAFQKEFSISYDSFGCIAPPNLSYYDSYNLLVFEYLTETFGAPWEEKIRQDAMALSEWKERE